MHFEKPKVSVEQGSVVVCKSDSVIAGDAKTVYVNLNVDTSLEEKIIEGIVYTYITSIVQAQWSYAIRVPNLAMLYRSCHVLVFAPNLNELLNLFHDYHSSVMTRIA